MMSERSILVNKNFPQKISVRHSQSFSTPYQVTKKRVKQELRPDRLKAIKQLMRQVTQ